MNWTAFKDYLPIIISFTALIVSVQREVREWRKARTQLRFHLHYVKVMNPRARPADDGTRFDEELQLTLTITNKGQAAVTIAAGSYSTAADTFQGCLNYLHPMRRLGQGEAFQYVFTIRPFPTTIKQIQVMDAEGTFHNGLSRRKMSAFARRYENDIAHVRRCAGPRTSA